MSRSRSGSSMAPGDAAGASRALKRAVDVAASSVGLLLASPLLLIACAAIWVEDRHSPFYVAPRIGRRGRPFRMVKLRSMVVRADRTGVDSLGPALHCSSRPLARYSPHGCHGAGRAIAATGPRVGGGNVGRDRGRSGAGGGGPPGGAARRRRASGRDRRGPGSGPGGGGGSVVARVRALTGAGLPQVAKKIRVAAVRMSSRDRKSGG